MCCIHKAEGIRFGFSVQIFDTKVTNFVFTAALRWFIHEKTNIDLNLNSNVSHAVQFPGCS